MGDQVPKLEEGELIERPCTRAASVLNNLTSQERLAELMRRIDTARTTYKLGAVELRLGPTSSDPHNTLLRPFTAATGLSLRPPTHSAAPFDTMFGYPGPSRVPEGYHGGNAGFANGNPGPPPSYGPQSVFSGGVRAHVAGSPAPGPEPLVRGGGRDSRSAGPVQQLSSECQRRRFNPG